MRNDCSICRSKWCRWNTILNFLPRFYDPQEGSIKIDNQDISKVKLSSLENISLVSQDTIPFDATVKENIAYANDRATQKEILEACKFAAADEFIDDLPNKLDTVIGENGVRLSVTKQRISIARAILKQSPIILLDEATSSLINWVRRNCAERYNEFNQK